MSEIKEMSASCDQSCSQTRNTTDSFSQLVTHHRRFLTTSFLACPNNRDLITPQQQLSATPSSTTATSDSSSNNNNSSTNTDTPAIQSSSTDTHDSFVHVENLDHVNSSSENANYISKKLSKLELQLTKELDGSGTNGITVLRDQLEDLVNNVVDDEKKVTVEAYI